MLLNWCRAVCPGWDGGLLKSYWGRTLPRVGLLLSGVAPLGGVLHQLGGGVMLPNWCNAPYVVERCTAWACWTPAWAAPARKTTCKLVVDEAVHPIRRHYTPSDRVYRDVTGARRRKGCTAACCSRDGGPLKSERERLAVWGSWAMRRDTPSGAVSPRNAALLRAGRPPAGAIAVWVKQARPCST